MRDESKINVSEIARRFADALDREDYETVRKMLSAECVYENRSGSDAIISSYRDRSAMARRLFDTVKYCSEVKTTGNDTASILFSDYISKQGRSHIYQCCQRLRLQPDGLIAGIRHEELPGERERLLEFCVDCNVAVGGA